MKIFKNFFKDNQKLNSNEIAIELSDGKYKTLNNKLKEIDKPLKKLWENPNTSNIFDPQKITLATDDYDYLIWLYLEVSGSLGSDRSMLSTMSLKGWSVALEHAYDGQVSVTADYYNTNWYRKITRTSDTIFNATECKGKRGNEKGVIINNIYCIPVVVYGGKF